MNSAVSGMSMARIPSTWVVYHDAGPSGYGAGETAARFRRLLRVFSRVMNVVRRILAGFEPWWSWALAKRLLLGIAVLGAATVVIAEAVSASPLDVVAIFDGPLILAVEASRAEWFNPIIGAVTYLANFSFMAILFVVLVLWAGLRRGRWDLIVIPAVAAGGAFGLSVLTKTIVWRGRPDVLVEPLVDAFGPSFPSGHSMRGVALYFAFAWVLSRDASPAVKVVAYAGAAAIAATAGFGRIYMGAHWPSDILAGGLVATLWTVYSLRLLARERGHLLGGPRRAKVPDARPVV
jgi:membrane-associated phospholipid phosphatase